MENHQLSAAKLADKLPAIFVTDMGSEYKSENFEQMLFVDEIQNVVNSKNGKCLIGALTQLINNSGKKSMNS